MKIINKIKSFFKKGTNIVLEEIEIHKEYNILKNEILKAQTLTELKNMCKEFELEQTPKDLYHEHLEKSVDLDQIIEYCKNKKINISIVLKKKQILDKKYIKHKLISNKFENNKVELKIKPKVDVNFKIK